MNESLKKIDYIFDKTQRNDTKKSDIPFNSELGLGLALPGSRSELKVDGSGTQLRHDGILVNPIPGFVVKTKGEGESSLLKRKIFINVCYHPSISPSSKKKKIDEEGKEVEGMNLPMSVGPIRSCFDKDGKAASVVDCIVNPQVKEKIEIDESGSLRNFVIQILLDYVEKKHQSLLAPIDRRYKLPRLCYKGYVDSRTGESIEKCSKFAETAKQYVRDTSKQPSIEEVTPLQDTTAATTSFSTNERMTNQSNKEKEGTNKRKDNGLELLHDIVFDFGLILSNGTKITLQDFLHRVGRFYSRDSKIQPMLINLEKDCTTLRDLCSLSTPFLFDFNVCQDTIVSKMVIEAHIPQVVKRRISIDDIKINISTYFVTISIPSHKKVECVFPFCASTSSVDCIFQKKSCILTIRMNVCPKSLIDDGPDIGSHIWTVTRAFSRDKEVAPIVDKNESKKCDSFGQDNHDEYEKKGNSFDNDSNDPFQINTKPCSGNNNNSPDNYDSNQKSTEQLPEDRFHAKDIISQHILAQQDKEREEKKRNYGDDPQSHFEKDNLDVDYLDINDFRPGGKYFANSDKCENPSNKKEDENHKSILNQGRNILLNNFGRESICGDLWLMLV